MSPPSDWEWCKRSARRQTSQLLTIGDSTSTSAAVHVLLSRGSASSGVETHVWSCAKLQVVSVFFTPLPVAVHVGGHHPPQRRDRHSEDRRRQDRHDDAQLIRTGPPSGSGRAG